MQFNAPKKVTWLVGLILAVVAVLLKVAGLGADVAFWVAIASAGLMLLATLLTNL
ncbi:MAG: hypothetical protein IJJ00_01270 [Erysipelotrichaceae bacterium]|nr:hypothetical protein [Erysipelotrichaceae bacterium]